MCISDDAIFGIFSRFLGSHSPAKIKSFFFGSSKFHFATYYNPSFYQNFLLLVSNIFKYSRNFVNIFRNSKFFPHVLSSFVTCCSAL